jgi:hypothetical protein
MRHGATKTRGCRRWPFAACFPGRVDPQFGRAVTPGTPGRITNRRLAGFAGRGFIANIGVAIAHDCYPSMRRNCNAHARGKFRGIRWVGRPTPGFKSRSELALRILRVVPVPGMNPAMTSAILPRIRHPEFIEFFPPMFRRRAATKQFAGATKPFSAFGADTLKQPTFNQMLNATSDRGPGTTGDSEMQTNREQVAPAQCRCCQQCRCCHMREADSFQQDRR